MSKHEKEDPEELSEKNGHRPGRFPSEDPGGKHQKPETDDKDTDDKDKK